MRLGLHAGCDLPSSSTFAQGPARSDEGRSPVSISGPRDRRFHLSRSDARVGIYIGNGQMVDAPHSGADVRVETTPATACAPWGTDVLIGITDPANYSQPGAALPWVLDVLCDAFVCHPS
jgi:hypothetical protein